MLYSEYLNLKFAGSKGRMHPDNSGETFWNDVRLVITENGVSRVQNLAGGVERIEEHLNNYLDFYRQQGWQPIRVERPEEKSRSRGETFWDVRNTILCTLKRSGVHNNNLEIWARRSR